MKLDIKDNLLSKIKKESLKVTKVAIALTLVTVFTPISSPIQAEAKGRVGGRISIPKTSPSPKTSKPNTSSNSGKTNNSNSGKNETTKPKNTNPNASNKYNQGPYKRSESFLGNNYNNYSLSSSPWFYLWLFNNHHNNEEEIQKVGTEDIYIIESMSYNETQSDLANQKFYDITFTNGIKTTALLKDLKEKSNKNEEYIYILINNTNIGVPVYKDDLTSWLNKVEEFKSYQYTK